MKKKPTPKPPKGLSRESAAWWRQLVAEYVFESHALKLLEAACRAWDRMVEAQTILKKQGLVYRDRFGAPRKHPAVSIEENARIAFARMVRELALDAEPPPEAPRPPRTGGWED